MATNLAKLGGGHRETRVPVASVRFAEGDEGNVISAFAEGDDYLFDLAYRPHEIGQQGYDEHGLFIC